jgi:pre-mRNA-splicing factor 38B
MARDSNVLAVWGNKESMNLNSLVLNNIMSSQYFKNALYEKKTYHEVVDEIYYQVNIYLLLYYLNSIFIG